MACHPAVTRRHTVPWPLALLVSLLLPCTDAVAQAQALRRGDRVTVRAGTALRSTPGGEVIGVSSRPITGAAELVQSGFVRVTIDGFLPASQVRISGDRRRGEVAEPTGATLRASASAAGAAVAELRRSAYVFPPQAGGTFPAGRPAAFLPVRRSLWVDVSRVTGPRTAAAPSRERTAAREAERSAAAAARERPTAAPADSADAAAPVTPSPVIGPTLETASTATVRAGPGGEVIATLPAGVPVTSLAREDGWVRVRVEGWLPDSSVGAAGARSAGSLTAADLRADPVGTVGRLVRWSVEALAFQTADALRQGLAPGERYLLARGPDAERAVLYLAVPDSLAAVVQALPPLTEIRITARVRNGRSQPSGVPILDLLELTRR